jgi:NTE family protein
MRILDLARLVRVVLVIMCFWPHQQALRAAPTGPDELRPRVGLVLSGGGARGAAHVGVLKVLEESRVPVDYIAGTSMGAIVGGLYASGMSADEIGEAIQAMDWKRMFRDDLERQDRSFRRKRDDDLLLVKAQPGFDLKTATLKLPLGLIEGQRVTLALKEFTVPVAEIRDFDDLPTAFRAVATDIGNGQTAVLGEGDLALAISGSMAIPGIFSPTIFADRLLVDGGITNNLPVDVAREMGADVLIVVDISTPLHDPEDLTDIVILTDQLTSIMTRANTERNLATLTSADVAIVPRLGDISTGDFDRTGEAVELGYQAAAGMRSSLQALGVGHDDYEDWLAGRSSRRSPPPVVDFIEVETDVSLDRKVLLNKIEQPVGEPLQTRQMNRNLDSIYGLELFEKVDYEVAERDGETGVVVDARAKRWGPDYLQFGMDLEDDFEGNTLFNLRVAYLKTAMNELGGEWRSQLTVGEEPGLFSEWYQPLDTGMRYFVNPGVFYGKRNVNFFEGGSKAAQYRVTEYGFQLAGGRELGNWGEIRAGYEFTNVGSSLQIGDPADIEKDYNDARVFLRFEVDELDDVNFPRHGHAFLVNYDWHSDALGDDINFDQVTFGAGMAMTWGRYTVFPNVTGGKTMDGETPISRLFQLGGFLRLSGFETNELSGEEFLLGEAVFFRRMNDIEFLPVYIGGSLEYGAIGEDIDLQDDGKLAGSLFLGIDSFVGPLYIGAGFAEGGNQTGFMFLGRRF